MNKKINNYIILIACILIVVPFYKIIPISNYYINLLIYYIPVFIGYLLISLYYKLYNRNQKRLVYITICITIINMLAVFYAIYLDYNDSWQTKTMADMGAYIIPSLLWYVSYFAQRILGIILGIKLIFKKG